VREVRGDLRQLDLEIEQPIVAEVLEGGVGHDQLFDSDLTIAGPGCTVTGEERVEVHGQVHPKTDVGGVDDGQLVLLLELLNLGENVQGQEQGMTNPQLLDLLKAADRPEHTFEALEGDAPKDVCQLDVILEDADLRVGLLHGLHHVHPGCSLGWALGIQLEDHHLELLAVLEVMLDVVLPISDMEEHLISGLAEHSRTRQRSQLNDSSGLGSVGHGLEVRILGSAKNTETKIREIRFLDTLVS